MKMEHLNKRWVVRKVDGVYRAVTEEAEPWHIVQGIFDLPGDPTDEKTLRYICRLHNAELKPTVKDIHKSIQLFYHPKISYQMKEAGQ